MDDQITQEANPSGSLQPAGYAAWAVVYRDARPVSAFATRAMAEEWIRAEPHRRNDWISGWHLEMPERSRNRKLWMRIYQRRRREAKRHNYPSSPATPGDGAAQPKGMNEKDTGA